MNDSKRIAAPIWSRGASLRVTLGVALLTLASWVRWGMPYSSQIESQASLIYPAFFLAAVAGLVIFIRSFRGRLLWFVVLVVVASAVIQDRWLETAIAFVLVVGLLVTYRQFLGKLLIYAMSHPSQALVLIVYFCLLYGLAGTTNYGVPSLFWNETFNGRFLSALGSTLFLAVLGTSAFFLDDDSDKNQRRFMKFLNDWKVDYSMPGRPGRAASDEELGTNAIQVTRFLRLARLPFLTIISLPALFPLVFPNVPRLAPVRNLPGWLSPLTPTIPDVGRDWRAWTLNVLSWGSGLLVGIAVVKFCNVMGVWLEKRWGVVATMTGWSAAGGRAEQGGWFRSLFLPVSSILIVLVAFSVNILINVRVLDPVEREWVGWLSELTVWTSLALAVWWSGWRAYQLRPKRWPPFLRFLVVSGFVYTVLAISDTTIRSLKRPDWPWLASPGMAIFALLITVSLLFAGLGQLKPKENDTIHKFRSDRLALALVVLWIAVMNGDDFKLQFKGLSYDRAKRADWTRAVEDYRAWGGDRERGVPERPIGEKGLRGDSGLLNDAEVLNRWRKNLWLKSAPGGRSSGDPPEDFKPKLAVVCATGGASRAAYWTAVVLKRLGEEIPGFHDHIRLVTGASGGMVGAAYYVNWRNQDDPDKSNRDWVRNMPTDTLSTVASHIALIGVAQSLVPRRETPFDLDRGQALENQWVELQIPFISYREREKDGKIPSLVFSPVTVDDGRRLLISNLGLERIAVNGGSELNSENRPLSAYSVAAPEFYRVFGESGYGLTVATAARMAATFPAVSPAVNLPTEPPIRLVDAGYYDNYGVNLAVAWTFKNRRWLNDYTSGVVLVQIRAFLGRHERLGPPRSKGDALARGVEFFTTPFEAFAGARDTTPMFRNDEEIAALGEIFSLEKHSQKFFTTVIFENSAQVLLDDGGTAERRWPFVNAAENSRNAPATTDVAMTWHLSEQEKKSMDRVIPSEDAATHWRWDGEALVETNDKRESLYVLGADRLRWIERIRDEIRKLGDDPKDEAQRYYYVKEFERALNYERVRALKAWWE